MQWLVSNTSNDGDTSSSVKNTTGRQRGVLLVNLGAPDSPNIPDVRRYLAEFLTDPEVVRLPGGLGWLRRPLGHVISWWRAPQTAPRYRRIWGQRGSALRGVLEDQTKSLSEIMPPGWRVAYAMRYGRPSIAEAIKEFESAGIDELVVVPMYPQYSGATTGTAIRELYASLRRNACHLSVTTRCNWFDDRGYIRAQARLLHDYVAARDLNPRNSHLVFSSHGMPASYIDRGDPYARQVLRTVRLVVEHLGWPTNRASVAYHGKIGPVRWLEPTTAGVLSKRVREGERQLVVCPIGITTDSLDTLEQLDRDCRSKVEDAGAKLHVCPALNTFGPFVAALKDLVLNGPKPVTSWGKAVKPLLAESKPVASDAATNSLIMVGAALPGRIGQGDGPALPSVSAGDLKRIKRSQTDVPAILREIMDRTGLKEAWLWNTCNRFELYGWIKDVSDEHGMARSVETIKSVLAGGGDRLENCESIGVLFGCDAWHHLLRTAAGLNSQLPGERDVLDQLKAAHRLAHCAGASGPLSERLLQDVTALIKSLRSETHWGEYDPDYCHAALLQVIENTGLDVAACKSVVIGGSTTSASVLRSLIGRFDVPSRQLSLVYRGHKRGGNIKLLRKAIGNGRRIRVQSYGGAQLAPAVRNADVIALGIDTNEPVLHFESCFDQRDFDKQPLTVIDFNLFGSTTGFEDRPGVTLFTARHLEEFVNQYADAMTAEPEFETSVKEAEAWILSHLLESKRVRPVGRLIGAPLARASACVETLAAIATFGRDNGHTDTLSTLPGYQVEGAAG